MKTLVDFLLVYGAPYHIRFVGQPHECVAVNMSGLDAMRHELFRLSDYNVSACVSGNFVELVKK